MSRIIKQLITILKSVFILRRKGINISPLAYYDNSSRFSKNIYIDRFCNLHNVRIDQYSYVGYGTSINYCQIGKYCSIGADVKIGLGKHPISRVSTSPIFYSNKNSLGIKIVEGSDFKEFEEVKIGNDVWIGSNAIVMGGITIGDGAIIAAGSVVTKNVKPYAIVGGIPAKVIKYRFEEEEICKLLELKWWNWSFEKIKKNKDKFRDLEGIFE
jgi:acetyltransferase-like isoleucine patch superfamily enzyme